MIPVEKALKIIERETTRLATENVPLSAAVGRVLAEDVAADMDLPPFDRSQMDGFALRSKDVEGAPVVLEIVGESAAGKGWHKKLKKGEAVRIMTGAPVPEGADAVQKIELTRESGATGPDRGTDMRHSVEILHPVEKGRFIVPEGFEVKRGDAVLRAGTEISPNSIAVLAAFGYSKLKVSRLPRVTVLSTGSEIVDVGAKPKKDQIRNSNSPMLAAFLRDLGIEADVQPIARDELEELKAQISQAARSSDLVIITGGVSVGKYDLTRAALAELGAKVFFEKVALKPGKPTVFSQLGRALVFGLPGNPVSSAVTFFLFVRKAILLMQQAKQTSLPGGFAVLEAEAKGAKERDTYLPAALATGPDGRLLALPLKWHGSSDFVSFARADVLVAVPKEKTIPAGEAAEVLFLT